MLGKGVRFSIWQYGDGKTQLWDSSTWLSTSSEKKSFEILYQPTDGSTIELRVECKGLNVNAPAIWINPRFEAPMDGEQLPARPIPSPMPIPDILPPPKRPIPVNPMPIHPHPPIDMGMVSRPVRRSRIMMQLQRERAPPAAK
mmetsp:Transcript_24405/g.34128  ORF Transcript_24405/g.34128 Transcript_24405/m.34128 type:complete len:143 (+) Transcript_24405:220-648(+)